MITKTKNTVVIDWNPQELRYVWAESLGKRVKLRALGCLSAEDQEKPGTEADSLAALLGKLKAQIKVRKADVVVVLSRAEVEENTTTLPAAEVEEFQQLAFHQAHEFWHEAADTAAVDYYSLDSTAEGMRDISLVLLPAERKRSIEKTVESLGWNLAAIQLRHLNSTNLLRENVSLNHPISVLINLNRQSVDLVLLARNEIAQIRTIAVSQATSSEEEMGRLKLEIQRSLMMIPQLEGDRELGPVPLYLFADPDDLENFQRYFGTDPGFEIRLKNPLAFFELAGGTAVERVHEYSSLLGSLIQADGEKSIDLKAPKCRKKGSSVFGRLVVYGLALSLAAALLGYFARSSVSEARQKNQALRQEIKKVENNITDLKKRTAVVDYIQRWENDDVNWLEELRSLSLKFPGRDKTQVRSMNMSIGSNRRGVVSMNIRASNEGDISNLEQAIRDEYHQVRTNALSQAASEGNYGWQFAAVVSITPRSRLDLIDDPLLSRPESLTRDPLPSPPANPGTEASRKEPDDRTPPDQTSLPEKIESDTSRSGEEG
jgi:Tfp pilus assembly protein PilN